MPSTPIHPHPRAQGKEIGDSFIPCGLKLQDGNSRAIKGGSWALPTPHISFLEVRRRPQPHIHRKGCLEAKVESCQGMFPTHKPFP